MRYAPHAYHAPHAHDPPSLTLVIRGEVEERVAARVERAGPLSVVVKPAGVVHSDTFGANGACTLQVTLSGHDAAEAAAATPRLDGWRWTHAGAAARALLALFRLTAAGGPAPGAESVDDLVLEAVAALEPATAGQAAPRWLREAHALLASGPLSIRTLAGVVGVHPVHLAHEFRRHHGHSPSEFRRRERLRRAARSIVETRRPLAAIAAECGFADQAHMTRAVRRALGETPRGLRRLAAV
jgi:AraC family transcriptional regulator